MNCLLLDTNAYAAIVDESPDALTLIFAAEKLYMSVISIGELLLGFAAGTRESQNRRLLEGFLASSGVQVLPILNSTATLYARVGKTLRAAGRPIPTNDLWIAATAIEHSLPLFTYDRHFSGIPGIRTISSIADLDDEPA
jgi:tRNA(fMet)-specific endonuclease VapC